MVKSAEEKEQMQTLANLLTEMSLSQLDAYSAEVSPDAMGKEFWGNWPAKITIARKVRRDVER